VDPAGSCAALDTAVAGRTAGAFDDMPAGMAAEAVAADSVTVGTCLGAVAVDSVTVGTCLGAAVACIAAAVVAIAAVAANAANAANAATVGAQLHNLGVVAERETVAHHAVLGLAPKRKTQIRNRCLLPVPP